MQTPLVSIIIPIYKVEPYLRRCLDSIVNQTYTNLEIILVDDGSPDGCPQICDEYAAKDKRIVVIHKENGGLSDARNAGLDICKGEYVYFVDSDDFISHQAIETLYQGCVNFSADIAVGNYISFSKECEIQTHEKKDEFKTISFDEAIKMQIYPGHKFTQIVVAWNKLIKASLARGNPFPKGLLYEDNFTTYKYFYQTKAVITSSTIYYYQNRQDSIVNWFRDSEESEILSIKYNHEKMEYLKKLGLFSLAELFIERLAEQKLKCYVLTDNLTLKKAIAHDLKKIHLKKRPLLNLAIHHPQIWKFIKNICKVISFPTKAGTSSQATF